MLLALCVTWFSAIKHYQRTGHSVVATSITSAFILSHSELDTIKVNQALGWWQVGETVLL